MYNNYEMDLAGRTLKVEIGKLAEFSGGAVLISYGDTVVFVSTTASEKPREGMSFFPLSCDFEERLYAVGKIPGGFIKREGRPTEKAILTSRLIDRPIRPLFPKGFRNDVQIVATAMSIDPNITPDTVAMIGSSVALSISDIPFAGPTGSVTVGLVDGEYIINPDSSQRDNSDLHLIVSGTKDAVMMVEAGANEVSESVMLEAIIKGHEVIKEIVEFIEKIVAEVGKPKREFDHYSIDESLEKAVVEYATESVKEALQITEKSEREAVVKIIEKETCEHLAEVYPDNDSTIKEVIDNIIKVNLRDMVLNKNIRVDGRKPDEIRPISSEVSVLPRTHGSGLFKRGQTQVLTVATLGVLGDVQILDGLGEEDSKRFMHHYNFPPYSVGETRMMRGPGRREIGHGALAERALEPMIPAESEFPYTIRLVSEVMASNGSTSQASVCGSTLALMDAGVPIKAPVAGIAMGLIKDSESDKVVVLSDIIGQEDFNGDMDFKVAGTAKGITAIQMDIKIKGISREILETALNQAYIGRTHIMNKMLEVIPEPNKEISPLAPKIITTKINPEKIGDVIGPGGKIINGIIKETGVKIDIEDDGTVYIAAVNKDSAEKALAIIEGILKEVEPGKTYLGKVVRILPFGAFVEVLPGKDGLVHISKLDINHVKNVEDVVKIGDEILVKVTEIDKQGRINLSRKSVLEEEEKQKEQKDIN